MYRSLSLRVLILFLLPMLLLSSSSFGKGGEEEKSLTKQARTLVNLLDYIGQDYPNAVKDGKVINDFEYKEMVEFTEQSRSYFEKIRGKVDQKIPAGIPDRFAELDSLIQRKDDPTKVLEVSNSIKKDILKLGLIRVAPEDWPSLSKGEEVYMQKCKSCHGGSGKGDGPSSQGLEPPPTNFLDKDLMRLVAPLKVFNTARLGIEGTSMRAFNELSDEEVWNVAFYITSLRYQEFHKDSLDQVFGSLNPEPTLEKVSRSSDKELFKEYQNQHSDKKELLGAMRLHQGNKKKENEEAALAIAHQKLDEALVAYKNGDHEKAKDKAIAAYLDGVEPVEKRIKASSPKFVGELENKMLQVRADIRSEQSPAKVEASVKEAKETLDKAATMLSEQHITSWFAFLMSFSIIIREGLEAFLVIITILSVLKSLNVTKAQKWVHSGWLIALLIGVGSWFFADALISLGMGSIEVMEGIGALTAVVILLYIGFWLHSKTEASRWKAFIENKIVKLTKENNMFGLALLAFIVVFREAFESVIFLSALNLEVEKTASASILSGVIVGLVVVLILAWIALRYAKKIPVRKLFRYSAVMMGILAIILAGKGIHSIQESGIFSATAFPFDLRVSLLGIYPTIESLLAQTGVLLLSIAIWLYGKRPAY